MSLTIVNKEEHELIKKIAKRTEGYTKQIKMCNKTIKEQDEKIDTIYKFLMQSIDTCNEKEDSRRKLASKIGGLTTSLNTQKEKNKLLLKLSKSLEKQLDVKTKENEKAEKELEEIKRQLEFFKNHRKAYSMEEYKNYVECRKELEKRLKENNEGRAVKQ